MLTYTVEEDSWPQGVVSPQGIMKTEQSFGKVDALIWTQAAVHASQQVTTGTACYRIAG